MKKKSSFVRETEKEHTSKEAIEESEKGIWDHVKEKFNIAKDFTSDAISYIGKKVVEIAIETAPLPVRALWKIKKFFFN